MEDLYDEGKNGVTYESKIIAYYTFLVLFRVDPILKNQANLY